MGLFHHHHRRRGPGPLTQWVRQVEADQRIVDKYNREADLKGRPLWTRTDLLAYRKRQAGETQELRKRATAQAAARRRSTLDERKEALRQRATAERATKERLHTNPGTVSIAELSTTPQRCLSLRALIAVTVVVGTPAAFLTFGGFASGEPVVGIVFLLMLGCPLFLLWAQRIKANRQEAVQRHELHNRLAADLALVANRIS